MLQVTEVYSNTFYGNKFKLGSSATSYFIPIINCHVGNSYHRVNNEIPFILYEKPLYIETSSRRFVLKDFLQFINEYFRLIYVNIGTSENKVVIKVAKGYIVNEKDEILLVLTTKPNKLSLNYQERYSKTALPKEKAKDLTLLVSTELLINPVYSNFYKKLEKEYISDAYKAEIPVIFTTSSKIEKLTYSNEFQLQFNTVDELKSHLNENVKNILFKTDEEFQDFNPGIGSKLEARQEKYVPNEIIWEESEPITPTDAYIAGFDPYLVEEVVPVVRRRNVINLIDDTEEPQVDDIPY